MKHMTEKQDMAYDKKHGLKENSKADIAQDKKMGVGGGGPRTELSKPDAGSGKNLGGSQGSEISGHVKANRQWGGIETSGLKDRQLKGDYEAVK